MRNSLWWTVIIILFIIILVLAWFLFMTPGRKGLNHTATSTPIGTSTGAVSTTTGRGTGTGMGTATGTTGTTTQPTKPVIQAPMANATLAKTFTVLGQAPGNWFFEGVFPIKVIDQNGNAIARAQAHAQGDWMTSAMVPFTANVTVANYSGPATIVLSKDNPSGLPQNDASFSIPITIQ